MALGIVTPTPEQLAPLIAGKDLIADLPLVRTLGFPAAARAEPAQPKRETVQDYAPGTAERLARTLRAKRLQLQRMERMTRSRLFRHFVSADDLDELMNEVCTYEAILERTFGMRETAHLRETL